MYSNFMLALPLIVDVMFSKTDFTAMNPRAYARNWVPLLNSGRFVFSHPYPATLVYINIHSTFFGPGDTKFKKMHFLTSKKCHAGMGKLTINSSV